MDKQTESREAFKKWWNKPEQIELRLSCAEGWGFHIWTACRESLVVELPYAGPAEDEFDYHYNRGVEATADAIRAIGIRIKGEGV
ncbi:hypothetical protein [Serratia fonticola]